MQRGGREQKGSICSELKRAESGSIAVCEFLHGEKKHRLKIPVEKGRTRGKSW